MYEWATVCYHVKYHVRYLSMEQPKPIMLLFTFSSPLMYPFLEEIYNENISFSHILRHNVVYIQTIMISVQKCNIFLIVYHLFSLQMYANSTELATHRHSGNVTFQFSTSLDPSWTLKTTRLHWQLNKKAPQCRRTNERMQPLIRFLHFYTRSEFSSPAIFDVRGGHVCLEFEGTLESQGSVTEPDWQGVLRCSQPWEHSAIHSLHLFIIRAQGVGAYPTMHCAKRKHSGLVAIHHWAHSSFCCTWHGCLWIGCRNLSIGWELLTEWMEPRN